MDNNNSHNQEIERDDIFDKDKLLKQTRETREVEHIGEGKSFWFKLMFFVMIFIVASLIYRGVQLYITNDYLFRSVLNEDAPEMPSWYPISTIVLSVFALIGLFLTFAFKKIGPYIVVASLFISAIVQPEFMADGTLFTLFALFVFIGYGLAIIYPYWKKFS